MAPNERALAQNVGDSRRNQRLAGAPSPGIIARVTFDCGMRGGVATFEREASWQGGMIYAACKRWKGRDSELVHAGPHHSIVLTLSGGTTMKKA
jgi:hypothetical protein